MESGVDQMLDDYEFPPWISTAINIPSDIVDRTEIMKIGGGGASSNIEQINSKLTTSPYRRTLASDLQCKFIQLSIRFNQQLLLLL